MSGDPDDVTVRWELRKLAELHLLEDAEIVCELADAVSKGLLGMLVVTDLNVRFLSTGLLRRRTKTMSVPLDEIQSAEVFDSPSHLEFYFKRYGALAIHTDERDGQSRVDFERIRGGRARAEELVGTILRQKELLARRLAQGPEVSQTAVDDDAEEGAFIAGPLRVFVGRGVASYVTANGGRLYLWAESFGRSFDRLEASTEPPAGLEFVVSDAVSDFEFYVEPDMPVTASIHLARRWWGLRRGVVADTGLMIGGGA